jgi:pimeloyl-ACP methyl ester carboxylesterase
VPPIQYAKTTDGLSIAYWAVGQGDPVVDLGTPPFSHIQLEWEMPEVRAWYERFAEHHLLVRYDGRGTGLSTRDITDYSLDGMVNDLEAVVDRLRLPPLTLIGSINSGLAAIVFAARRPERVARLILWCAYAQGSEYFEDTGSPCVGLSTRIGLYSLRLRHTADSVGERRRWRGVLPDSFGRR